jgi:PAS domain S-box-containing protein
MELSSQELLLANTEMGALLQVFPDTILILDNDGQITDIRAGAAAGFALSPKETIGRKFQSFAAEGMRETFDAALQRSRTQQTVESLEYSMVLHEREYSFDTRIVPLTDDRLIAIVRDITEKRELQAQLLSSQKLESIGQLAAGIAHEINTPIQFIGDNTRFLQDEFSNVKGLIEGCIKLVEAEQCKETKTAELQAVAQFAKQVDAPYLCEEIPRAIQQSLEGIDRVTSIVRAMKEFSHPGTGSKQAIDINKAIESTIVVSTNEWKYVAEVETQFDQSLPFVPCLVGEFNQVILNLVINSAHAMAEMADRGPTGKGRITIITKNLGDFAEIRLQDTGCGIPEQIIHKIFDPFFTTKEVGKGTGQGLAIARTIIVNKHGGTIEVESVLGKGTTFILRLPTDADSAIESRKRGSIPVVIEDGL